MIDGTDHTPHPLVAASNLLKRMPINRRGVQTPVGEIMRQAAVVIRELYDENKKLKSLQKPLTG